MTRRGRQCLEATYAHEGRYHFAKRGHGDRGLRKAAGSTQGSSLAIDPFSSVKQMGSAILDALDPSKAPGIVKRFSPAEIAALNAARAVKKGVST